MLTTARGSLLRWALALAEAAVAVALILLPGWRGPGSYATLVTVMVLGLLLEYRMQRSGGTVIHRLTLTELRSRIADGRIKPWPWADVSTVLSVVALVMGALNLP